MVHGLGPSPSFCPVSPSVSVSAWKSTVAHIVSWITRVVSAAVVLSLIGLLIWALSLSGSWYLPAGGAAAGAVFGWIHPSPRSGKADTALTYTVWGAAIGMFVVFLYHSACTLKDPRERDPTLKASVEAMSVGARSGRLSGGGRALLVHVWTDEAGVFHARTGPGGLVGRYAVPPVRIAQRSDSKQAASMVALGLEYGGRFECYKPPEYRSPQTPVAGCCA